MVRPSTTVESHPVFIIWNKNQWICNDIFNQSIVLILPGHHFLKSVSRMPLCCQIKWASFQLLRKPIPSVWTLLILGCTGAIIIGPQRWSHSQSVHSVRWLFILKINVKKFKECNFMLPVSWSKCPPSSSHNDLARSWVVASSVMILQQLLLWRYSSGAHCK